MSITHPIPLLPDMVLRVGFAGNRELPDDIGILKTALQAIFETIDFRMSQLATLDTKNHTVPKIAEYYSSEPPVARLITGLSSGADALAVETFLNMNASKVRHKQAAVVPYDLAVYRSIQSPDFIPVFDKLLKTCEYVLEIDGRYGPTEKDRPYRARAYRAQSTLLLRQADIMIAAVDPEKTGKAGGTLETIQNALEFDLPVIAIHAITGKVLLLEPVGDRISTLSELFESEGCLANDVSEKLGQWVTNILADPDIPTPQNNDHSQHGNGEHQKSTFHGEKLLQEYFVDDKIPLRDANGKKRKSIREKIWSKFESWFQKEPLQPVEPDMNPYVAYRNRATSLNYYYAGNYRGAFIVNYSLAVVAVLLASLSLVVLGKNHSSIASQFSGIIEHDSESHNANVLLLIVLALLKLSIVITIYFNTHRANKGNWNDKAIDFRYLAERLRMMYYLPGAGSFQPPAAAKPQYVSRVVRQSAIDWLFDALVRHVSPVGLAQPTTYPFVRDPVPIIHLNPDDILSKTEHNLIEGQIVYHQRNEITMKSMHRVLNKWGKWLNYLVIGMVSIDLVFLIGLGLRLLPENIEAVFEEFSPWLVFFAAFLPAAVASLNGIRFQSECHRLSVRSWAMVKILQSHATRVDELQTKFSKVRDDAVLNPGSRVIEVLHVLEGCMQDMIQEVAEWSVIYARDVAEP